MLKRYSTTFKLTGDLGTGTNIVTFAAGNATPANITEIDISQLANAKFANADDTVIDLNDSSNRARNNLAKLATLKLSNGGSNVKLNNVLQKYGSAGEVSSYGGKVRSG